MRPFASICGHNWLFRPSGALRAPQNGPQMNANSRKWAYRALSWPIFRAFRGYFTGLGHSSPVASHFQPRKRLSWRKMPLVGPLLRDRHYLAPHKRHKADFARILALSARSLFPEPAARCAVDPPPHFLYSLATQEISPRHVKPTSGRLNTTVVH